MTTIEQRLSRLEGVYDHLATKADLAEVKTDMSHLASKADLAEVKTDMTHLATKLDLAALETRIAQVETTVAQVEARIVKWVVGTVITGMGVAAAVAVAVDRLLSG